VLSPGTEKRDFWLAATLRADALSAAECCLGYKG